MTTKILFTTDGFPEPILVTVTGKTETLSNARNVIEALTNAATDAKADGWSGFNYEIPNKYLKKYGISMKKTPCDITLGMEFIESQPVTLCACMQCSAYEEGNCYRYGGNVDGFATEDISDCIHGTGGKTITYGEDTLSFIPLNTDLSAYDTAEYIMSGENPELDGIKDQISEYLDEEGITFEESDKDLWKFDEDC